MAIITCFEIYHILYRIKFFKKVFLMTSCNYETDYSTVIGERILPFVFSLNTETSVLTPKPGEYQRLEQTHLSMQT